MPYYFQSQGHAEDVLLWHRYHYYVLGCPLIADAAYDTMERWVCERWPINGIALMVGSDNPDDYPLYIAEGRRPHYREREQRDWTIELRWLNGL